MHTKTCENVFAFSAAKSLLKIVHLENLMFIQSISRETFRFSLSIDKFFLCLVYRIEYTLYVYNSSLCKDVWPIVYIINFFCLRQVPRFFCLIQYTYMPFCKYEKCENFKYINCLQIDSTKMAQKSILHFFTSTFVFLCL